MLKNLELARETKKISLSQMGAVLGVRYQTVADKIKGISGFSFNEALLLRETFFPEYDIIFLFRDESGEKTIN